MMSQDQMIALNKDFRRSSMTRSTKPMNIPAAMRRTKPQI